MYRRKAPDDPIGLALHRRVDGKRRQRVRYSTDEHVVVRFLKFLWATSVLPAEQCKGEVCQYGLDSEAGGILRV